MESIRIEGFEDVLVWQKAKDLTVRVYEIFKYSKDFGFKDQVQRASVSIMNNIAEEISKMLSGLIKKL